MKGLWFEPECVYRMCCGTSRVVLQRQFFDAQSSDISGTWHLFSLDIVFFFDISFSTLLISSVLVSSHPMSSHTTKRQLGSFGIKNNRVIFLILFFRFAAFGSCSCQMHMCILQLYNYVEVVETSKINLIFIVIVQLYIC